MVGLVIVKNVVIRSKLMLLMPCMDSWAKSAVAHGCLRNHKRVHYSSKFQLEPTDGIHGLIMMGQDLILDHQSLRVCYRLGLRKV